jgi:hypothetical protein
MAEKKANVRQRKTKQKTSDVSYGDPTKNAVLRKMTQFLRHVWNLLG